MKRYEVRCRTNGETYEVEARDEYSAVRKAARRVVNRRRVGPVTWHGVHAECEGQRFNKPARIGY